MRVVPHILVGALAVWFLWGVARADSPVATKLLVGIPLSVLLSIVALAVLFPNGEDSTEGLAFWRPRPGGVGAPIPNAAHPAAKYVFGFWTVLLLIWIGALDEVLRHDFSNLADRILRIIR